MLIVVEIAEGYLEPCQTSKMNLFAKMVKKRNSKHCQIS